MNKDEYSQQETDARREAALKKLLATPHKPHVPLKIGTEKRTRKTKTEKQG